MDLPNPGLECWPFWQLRSFSLAPPVFSPGCECRRRRLRSTHKRRQWSRSRCSAGVIASCITHGHPISDTDQQQRSDFRQLENKCKSMFFWFFFFKLKSSTKGSVHFACETHLPCCVRSAQKNLDVDCETLLRCAVTEQVSLSTEIKCCWEFVLPATPAEILQSPFWVGAQFSHSKLSWNNHWNQQGRLDWNAHRLSGKLWMGQTFFNK